MTEDQKIKLIAATKKSFARMQAIARKHRNKIGGLLHQMDEKRVEAIKQKIAAKQN